ncbi:MAG TPA: M23 family metallopeptidase [Solirubrobacteraceae bacterium]|nr:M23 family metallopeptidase [Solirubrobacteraceae bacterium]
MGAGALALVLAGALSAGAPAQEPPPPPNADADADRVVDDLDLCPGTPAGARLVEGGCTLVQLAIHPGALMRRTGERLAESRQQVRIPGLLRRRLGGDVDLRSAGGRLRGAARRLAALDVCGGARGTATSASRFARGARRAAATLRADQRTIENRTAVASLGDADAEEQRWHELAIARAELAAGMAAARRTAALTRGLCRASRGRTSFTGRVRAVDSATDTITLTDGRKVAYGAAARIQGVAPGALIRVAGLRLPDSVVASSVELQEAEPLKPLNDCLVPRIAPVQTASSTPTTHDLRGYERDGRLLLEGGMGFAAGAQNPSCPSAVPGGGSWLYYLEVSLDYQDTEGIRKTRTLSLFVPEGTTDLEAIPNDVDGLYASTLTFRVYRSPCTGTDLSGCGKPELVEQRVRPATVRLQGAWAALRYDRSVFSVEDGSETDFDVATVQPLATDYPSILAGATIQVGAYAKGAGGSSTYPHSTFAGPGSQVAIHDDGPKGGAFWARALGSRNGFPYRYAARKPIIVTDAVAFCSDPPDNYYRLPWAPERTHEITQGNNNPDGTHKGGQKYAYDFVMPRDTRIRATRGGVVTYVKESLTKNVKPADVKAETVKWVPGNALRITHQDGLHSWYEHMPKNGIVPEKGDVVERGDDVGRVGNTGNSSDPHLHYHVTKTGNRGGTVPIRIQAIKASKMWNCMFLGKTAWMSSNAKPTS